MSPHGSPGLSGTGDEPEAGTVFYRSDGQAMVLVPAADLQNVVVPNGLQTLSSGIGAEVGSADLDHPHNAQYLANLPQDQQLRYFTLNQSMDG